MSNNGSVVGQSRYRFFAFMIPTVAFLAMIVLLEGVLKIVDYPKIPVSGWHHWPGIEDTNQLGHRGRYIDYSPDAFVVLLVGDSQVEYVVCADLVIHWQTLGNDVWNNIFPTHDTASMNGAPKPTFRLKGEQLIEPAQQIGQPAFRWRLWALIVHGVWGGLDAFGEMYLPPPYVPRESVLHIQGGERVSTEENLKSEKSHWSILLTRASPRMEYGISLTRQLLRTMEEIASTQGAQFIIFQEDRTTPLARKPARNFLGTAMGILSLNTKANFMRPTQSSML